MGALTCTSIWRLLTEDRTRNATADAFNAGEFDGIIMSDRTCLSAQLGLEIFDRTYLPFDSVFQREILCSTQILKHEILVRI